MKHGKKPTREQRKLMQKKVNCQDWLVERETIHELVLIHRHFDKIKVIPKGVRDDG